MTENINNFGIVLKGSFQRSRRLDTDMLDAGYVLLGTGRQALHIMAENIAKSRQRAFTWTGPYGCGKSSLALLLTALLGNEQERTQAWKVLGDDSIVASGLGAGLGWKVIRIVGHQGRLLEDIAKLLKTRRTNKAVAGVLERLGSEAASKNAADGVLLVIDELGKYLESENASENTYLLQELAELASRSSARIVVLGILHQAFDVYASRLPTEMRDEWAKVQGRFVDIPLAATTDETLELLSRALVHDKPAKPDAAFEKAVAAVSGWVAAHAGLKKDRTQELLAACWPLNPMVSLMLGPVSRRRFSQNERSIYSFLSAREPAGFAEFLTRAQPPAQYTLARFWDYLQVNFEPAILASTDAHRWVTAVDAVNRAETKLTPELVELAKTVAVIDLFHSGSRLQASAELIAAAVCKPLAEVKKALAALVEARVLIERKHANSWAVYAGSDFDLEQAMKEAQSQLAGVDSRTASGLVNLDPVVARSHYLETGTMRWFDRRLAVTNDLKHLATDNAKNSEAAGELILLIDAPEKAVKDPQAYLAEVFNSNGFEKLEKVKGRMLVLGLPPNAGRIASLVRELQAVNLVSKDPVLEGDATGRNEVAIRQKAVRETLSDELAKAFYDAVWYVDGLALSIKGSTSLTEFLSRLCAKRFNCTPRIVNELINRDYLSGNVVSARKELLAAMLAKENEEKLGFKDYRPAYGIFVSILKKIHRKSPSGGRRFSVKGGNDPVHLADLFARTTEYLKTHNQVAASDLYQFWRAAPFGIKSGPMPVLALAYMIVNRNALAVYIDGAFQSDLSQMVIDSLLADPASVKVMLVEKTKDDDELLQALTQTLSARVPGVQATALSVGRAIVKLVLQAPAWSQRTQKLSLATLQLRREAQKASDPMDFVMRKIPAIFKSDNAKETARALNAALDEYLQAAPDLYGKIKAHLFAAMRADPNDHEGLNNRAKAIKDLSGNMELEAFVTRMATFKGADADVIGLWNLTAGKPINMCSDLSVKECLSKIDQFAFAFRQQEAFASLRGRNSNRTILAIAASSGDQDLTQTIEISAEKAAEAETRAEALYQQIVKLDRDTAAAVLAKLGVKLLAADKEQGK